MALGVSGLFLFLLLGRASEAVLQATVGQDVTIACQYDAQHYRRLGVCWGRGAIPTRGCANEVIRSDGSSVTSRLSERYLLAGNLSTGDVSLTIRQVDETDSGLYGCRVDIPGWFNDHKHLQALMVVPARPNTLKVDIHEVKERTITVRWAPVFDGGRPITTFRIDLKNKQAPWNTALTTEVYNPELTQVTLVDLRPAKTYNIRMFAVNSVGSSDTSNVVTITTKEAAPEGPPLDMHLEALSHNSIKVTWKPPRPDLRNGQLRSYSISYREHDAAGRQIRRWQHQTVLALREEESIVLKDLKSSTQYGVLVQARTNAGIGPAATGPLCSTQDEPHQMSTPATKSTSSGPVLIDNQTSSPTVPATSEDVTSTAWEQGTGFPPERPDPPAVEIKDVKDNTISLFWTPGLEGGSPITGYVLEYKAVNASWDYTKTVVDFGPNQTEATIIEINPSTYNLRMFAKSQLGTSKASNVLTITTGQAAHRPDVPATTTATNTHASVSGEEGPGPHPAAIVVPVVLVVLTVAAAITWQLRRLKQKKISLDMWLTGRGIRYRGSETLQEV